jgi:hypothetical protein
MWTLNWLRFADSALAYMEGSCYLGGPVRAQIAKILVIDHSVVLRQVSATRIYQALQYSPGVQPVQD